MNLNQQWEDAAKADLATDLRNTRHYLKSLPDMIPPIRVWCIRCLRGIIDGNWGEVRKGKMYCLCEGCELKLRAQVPDSGLWKEIDKWKSAYAK